MHLMPIKRIANTLRLQNCAMGSIAVLIGAMTGNEGFDLDPFITITSMIHGAGMLSSANILNNIRDMELDIQKGSDKVLITSKKELLIILLMIFPASLISLALSVYLSGKIMPFFISISVLAGIIAYEYYLKVRGFSGNILVGTLIGSLFLFGGIYHNVNWTLIVLSVITALGTISREIIKDIEDMEFDRGFRNTLPLRIGPKNAAIVSLLMISIAFPVSMAPLLTSSFNVFYAALIMMSLIGMFYATYIVISDRSQASRSSTILKSAMVVSLLAFISYFIF